MPPKVMSDDFKLGLYHRVTSQAHSSQWKGKSVGKKLIIKQDANFLDLQRIAEGRGLIIRQEGSLVYLRYFASQYYPTKSHVRVFIPPNAVNAANMIATVGRDGYTRLEVAPEGN